MENVSTPDIEPDARQIIEQKIADWDAAFAAKDIHGYSGHWIAEMPAAELDTFRQSWGGVMWCADALTSRHAIHEFTLTEDKAIVVAQKQETMTFRLPDTMLGVLLLGWLTRVVFVENALIRYQWVNTREGWLCQSYKTLSRKMRLRRKPADAQSV